MTAIPETRRNVSERLRLLGASFSAVIAILVLAGWFFGIDALTRVVPRSIAMNPATAAVVLLLSLGIVCPFPRGVRLLAGVAILVGTTKLIQFFLGTSGGIDQILFADQLGRVAGAPPNRMAPNTAFALAVLGWALLLSSSRDPRAITMSHILCVMSAAIATVAAVGYALDVVALYQLHNYIAMALPTAAVLLLLSLAVISVNPDVGLGRIFGDGGPAGVLARTALPFAVVVPLTVGVLDRSGHQAGLYGLEAASALALMANVLVNFLLLGGCIVALFGSDEERKRREAAIAQSESQYRLAERVGHVGYWKIDLPTQSVKWSDGFLSICGLPADTRPSIEAIIATCHPEDAPIAREFITQSHCGDWQFACRVQRPDGEVRHVRSHGICVAGEDGTPIGIFAVFSDITELEIARQAAESAKETTASFLANMSHEIRTPMNGVMGFVELLLLSELTDAQRRHLVLIQDSARALLKLLNDILDISKIEAGRLEIAPTPYNVRHGITQCVRLMTPMAEQKSLLLSLNFAESVPSNLHVDGLRMRQIVLNLIGNAVKFTVEGSVSVEVSCGIARGENILQVAVRDTGVGIPRDRLDSIFDTFVQAEATTTRRFGGSGLGLSISRSLAEMMGGALRVESVVGKGTTITLVLPLVEVATRLPETDEENVTSTALRPAARRGASILLVEDVDLNRELFGEMLEELGHCFDFATDGANACELARRLQTEPDAWDLILMDLQMPVMDGLAASQAIRALGGRAATIPIIALTASAFDDEVRDCHAAGMNDHLAKPTSIDELSKVIDRWRDGAGSAEPRVATPAPPERLRQKYAAKREASRERLVQICAGFSDSSLKQSTEHVREARDAAHFLAGCAGMFGDPALGDIASAVERELEVAARTSPPNSTLRRLLQPLVDELQATPATARESTARRRA